MEKIIKKSATSNFIIDFFDNIFNNIALIFTKFFIKFNISANVVTFLSGVAVIIASILTISNNYISLILSILLFNIYIILDCSDGQVARAKNELNRGGQYFDLLIHMYAGPISKFCIGISIYLFTNNKIFILIAFLCSYYDAPTFAKYLSLGTLVGERKEFIDNIYVKQALYYDAQSVFDEKNKSFKKILINQIKALFTQPYFFIILNTFIFLDLVMIVILKKEFMLFRTLICLLLTILNLANIFTKSKRYLRQLEKIKT